MNITVSIICVISNLIVGYCVNSMIEELERVTQQIEYYVLLINEYKRRVTKLKAENEQLQKQLASTSQKKRR